MLKETFGELRSADKLYEAFNHRKQRDKEDLTTYLLGLMNLLHRAHSKDPTLVLDKEATLKENLLIILEIQPQIGRTLDGPSES